MNLFNTVFRNNKKHIPFIHTNHSDKMLDHTSAEFQLSVCQGIKDGQSKAYKLLIALIVRDIKETQNKLFNEGDIGKTQRYIGYIDALYTTLEAINNHQKFLKLKIEQDKKKKQREQKDTATHKSIKNFNKFMGRFRKQ